MAEAAPGFEEQLAEPGGEAPPPVGAFAPEEERLFQETRDALHAQKGPDGKSAAHFWFLLSLVLYVLYCFFFAEEGADRLPSGIALLVGTLLFHELGHIAGMRLFGYRDLRILFIPFLGAAAIGRKDAAPSWQQAIVLLLGPLPGIGLAGALYISFLPTADTILYDAVLLLVALNLFNLLPLVPLDGGRFLQVVVFSRAPILDSGFQLLACLGLVVLSFAFKTPVLGILALLTAVTLPVRFRQARHCSLLRSELGVIPQRIEDLREVEERCLFRAVRDVLPGVKQPTACARLLRQIHEEVLIRPPSAGATAGLLLAYGASFLVGLVVLVLVAIGANFTEEKLTAARELGAHLERFEQESQTILQALVKLREQPAESVGAKTFREEKRLREDLGRAVEETLERLEKADPVVRDLLFESEEHALQMLASLQEMRDGLREEDPLAPGFRSGSEKE